MSENTERLAAIQKRLGDATPGPWVTGGSGYVETVPEVDLHRFDIMPETIARAELREEDAEFIAAAPADVAFLLDLARKQQAALDAVQELVDHAFASPAYVLPGGYPSKPVEAFDLRAALEAKP